MKKVFLCVCVMLMAATLASADPINVLSTGTWTPFSPSAFWAGSSLDGSGCNVGNYVSGSGNCGIGGFYNGSPLANLSYLSESAFLFSPSQPTTAVMLQGLAGYTDTIGWYNATNAVNPVLHPLFNNHNDGATATFTPGGVYGLYIQTPDHTYLSGNFYSGDSHFALFTVGNGSYIVGMEDLPNGDWDYQDAIIRVADPQPVPEPASMTLLATGLFGLAGLVRKRNKK